MPPVQVEPAITTRAAARIGGRSRSGGHTGNARLTGLTGAVLLVLLAVEGVTLLSLQTLVSVHVFVGMLLVPVVALKVGSTGYRMLRYYTGHRAYVRLGPPPPLLRLVGPVVVLSTTALFASGVALAALGPGRPLVLGLHKASFAVWLASMTVHVLAHVLRIPALTTPDLRGGGEVRGARLRLGLVAAAVVAGSVIAVATLPLAAPWLHVVGMDG